jgi:thioesterase domain-containing protein
MLYIVDGTGPAGESEYRAAMCNSHCSYLQRRFWPFSRYIRGPAVAGGTDLGRNTMTAIEMAALANPLVALTSQLLGINEATTNQKSKVLQAIASEPTNAKIYLCGYSRGGATVVSIAAELNRQGREVEALFLFDPVDSDASLGNTGLIPPNVKQPFMAFRNMEHVRALERDADRRLNEAGRAGRTAARDVLSANVIPAIPSVLPIRPVEVTNAVRSVAAFGQRSAAAATAQWESFRWSQLMARDLMFQCCVTGLAGGGRSRQVWQPQGFNGTHGALGGCVWPREDYPRNTSFFAVDEECARATRRWLNECISQCNLTKDAIRFGA